MLFSGTLRAYDVIGMNSVPEDISDSEWVPWLAQKAVQHLRGWGFSFAVDLIGGLEAWQRDVDGSFPCY